MAGQIRELNYLSERQVQRLWFDKIGKFLGFPESGSKALWPTNAERFGGQGTFIYRLFSGDTTFTTKTWMGFGEGLKSSEAIPLMTRTVADTKEKVVFFAGLYGAKEALRSYNAAGGTFVDRNTKLEDLVSAYKLANPDIEPDPVAEGQTRLDDFSDDTTRAKDEMERFNKPVTDEGELKLTDQEKRMQLMQLVVDLSPPELFDTTQNDVLGTYGNNWIFAVMSKPTDEYGNIYYNRYTSDGFVPFMDYADNLIKFFDRQIALGSNDFAKINEYFKKIVEEGQFKDAKTNAIWMVRPPNNNRQLLEMFGAYEQFPLQKTFFNTIKKSTVDWKSILKAEMAPPQPPPDDDDDEKEKKVRDKFTTNRWGKRIINKPVRQPSSYENEDGTIETEGDWKSTPLGQRLAVTSNWEDVCCQKLKENLIKLLTVEIENTGKDIHKDKIERTVLDMHCADLSEYMEPEEIQQSNFHNLRIFGIKIGDLSGRVLEEALGVSGKSVQAHLTDEYEKCLEDIHGSVKKPPSETTDPVKTKVWAKRGDAVVELNTDEHREFENFSFDTGMKEGEITDDEKTYRERQMEEIIQGKQIDMDDDSFQADRFVQPMQEQWWKGQQEARKRPGKDKFLKLYKHSLAEMGYVAVDLIELDQPKFNNTPFFTASRQAINWGDRQLMERMGFTQIKWDYTFSNWKELFDRYIGSNQT